MANPAGESSSFIFLGGAEPSRESGDAPVIFSNSQLPDALPRPQHEYGNVLICVAGAENGQPFGVLARQVGESLELPFEGVRCFPFYTYNEDGSIRRENITDSALNRFREHYNDPVISKWSIFDYVYGVLHHPAYASTYANDLKRGSPRIPLATSFRGFQRAGQKLIELHLHADKLEPWELQVVHAPGATPESRATPNLRLSSDGTWLKVNNSVTFTGIPPEASEYRLANRPAIEWLIDQQLSRVEPYRKDNPNDLARLSGQVVRLCVETVHLVKALPAL